MISEDFVSFETAKLLKEKGFDETCRAFWKDWDDELNLCDCSSSHVFEFCFNSMLEQYNDDEELNIACPTLQMAMKWLIEEYDMYIKVSPDINDSYNFYCDVYTKGSESWDNQNVELGDFSTYEEACEATIKYCLEKFDIDMPKKDYKAGDRIFYEEYPSREISTDIVKKVKESSYIDYNGKEIHYKWLTLWEDGNCSSVIEDYNCLPYSDPRVKDLIKKFEQFDKEKNTIIDSIISMLSPYDKLMQTEIIDMLKIKLDI